MPRFDDKEFNPKNYVKVNERLLEFRNTYKEGFITTIRTSDEFGVSFRTIVCRTKEDAEIYGKTGVAAATGHSYLSDDNYDEKAEEYAETVSVGRALANLGLKVEIAIASQEEMDQFARNKGETVTEDSEDDEEEAKPRNRFKKDRDDDADDEADDEDDMDDESDEDSEDEETEEPKLRSSRRFSRGKSSRFGGGEA